MKMTLTRLFFGHAANASPTISQESVLHDAMRLLLEPNEKRFGNLLLSRLLAEGCNLPLVVARPRFYALYLAAMNQDWPVPERLLRPSAPLQHAQFIEVLSRASSSRPQARQFLANAVFTCSDALKTEWQDTARICRQPDRAAYERRLRALLRTIFPRAMPDAAIEKAVNDWLPTVRRRLALALTTGLLRHCRDGERLRRDFGELPAMLADLQADHPRFTAFLAACEPQIPYFDHVVAQIFWRTLETLRLEARS